MLMNSPTSSSNKQVIKAGEGRQIVLIRPEFRLVFYFKGNS
jgi:hypothetical protein